MQKCKMRHFLKNANCAFSAKFVRVRSRFLSLLFNIGKVCSVL